MPLRFPCASVKAAKHLDRFSKDGFTLSKRQEASVNNWLETNGYYSRLLALSCCTHYEPVGASEVLV